MKGILWGILFSVMAVVAGCRQKPWEFTIGENALDCARTIGRAPDRWLFSDTTATLIWFKGPVLHFALVPGSTAFTDSRGLRVTIDHRGLLAGADANPRVIIR